MNGSYSKRIISNEDKPSLVKLFIKYEKEVYGEVQTSDGEIQEILDFIPAGDRIGLWKDGDLVAISILTEKDHRLPSLILGKPDENLGMYIEEMATELIKSAKARKEHISDSKTIILSANLEVEKRTFEKIGFAPTRYWYQMKRNLESLENPSIPSSYRISEFNPDSQAESLHETFEEVFSDHFDYHPTELEEFIKRFQRPSFDPTLWYLLKEKNDLIGFILCSVNEETQMGEISHVGIRRDWRRKGLAHLLLSFAFWKLYKRGMKSAALSVDSDNYTDATIVYQKSGMYVYRGFTRYDMEV